MNTNIVEKEIKLMLNVFIGLVFTLVLIFVNFIATETIDVFNFTNMMPIAVLNCMIAICFYCFFYLIKNTKLLKDVQ